MNNRKYAFNWDALMGNMDIARPSLGPTTRVEVYRLFQFTVRDMLEQRYGTEQCDELFREAGKIAGEVFFQHCCKEATSLNELVKIIQEKFKAMGIGILRVEKVDLDNMSLILTVDEDLDCSGLPDTNDVICVYDEGLIQGILQAYTGKNFEVKEIDCWCTGERSCRFAAHLKS
jgi:predicted hydrocarbon binding protein